MIYGRFGRASGVRQNKVKNKRNVKKFVKWKRHKVILLDKSLKMSSRGRPPKNGTPFDRLLKKQCQKGKNLTRLLFLVFLCQKSLVIIFSSIRFTSKSKQQKTRQNNCGQILKVKIGIFIGVSASKSAGIVGKWGATSFTSIRSASIPSEQVSRPKKFFKSKNTSESEYGDPMIQTPASQPAAVPKAPSKFFKSKNVPSAPPSAPAPIPAPMKAPQPVVTKPVMPISKQSPLRPLEVTSNHPPH